MACTQSWPQNRHFNKPVLMRVCRSKMLLPMLFVSYKVLTDLLFYWSNQSGFFHRMCLLHNVMSVIYRCMI